MQPTVDFHLRRKYFRFMGAEMRVLDHSGQLAAFAEARRLKLREEMTVYADEAKTQPLVNIKARQVIDFGATYDITDATSGQPLGALRRHGLQSSFVRDTWTILDPQEAEIGTIQEDSAWMGVVRRFIDIVSLFVPQRYDLTVDGQSVGQLQRSRNLFVLKYDMSFDAGYLERVGHKTALSYPVILALIEDTKQ